VPLPHHYRSHTHHLYWLHFERLEHPTLTPKYHLEMSDEKTHDREKLKPLVKKAKRRVRVKKEQQYNSLNDI
jgi:hypothetical protein